MAGLIVLIQCLASVIAQLPSQDSRSSTFEQRIQEMLVEITEDAKNQGHDIGMQIGWYSATEQFTVAAGTAGGNGTSARKVTPKDTFLYGSGTKTFTAAAVMRLIDQGKVKATDLVHVHVDPFLQADNGSTLADIFGPQVTRATVLDLLRMSAGIPDFETGDRDATLLENGDEVWPVYDNLWYAAEWKKNMGTPCQSKADCDCGTLPPLTLVTCNLLQSCQKAEPYPACWGKPAGYPLKDGWKCYSNFRVGFCPTKTTGSPLLCSPGTCSSYSSTSYELAGLLLAAVAIQKGAYTDMDLGEYAFPSRDRYPSLVFPPVTSAKHPDVSSMKISDHLTCPGHASFYFGDTAEIFGQNPTVLGWTCGHMVGAAGDVAKFFYDLLDSESPRPVVSNASRAEMARTKPLSFGWGKGLPYGAGLMKQKVSRNSSYDPKSLNEWGYFLGHGAVTYGFNSNQGYLERVRAGFSVASNTDLPMYSFRAMCKAMMIAAEVLRGEQSFLGCTADELGAFAAPARGRAVVDAFDWNAEQREEIVV